MEATLPAEQEKNERRGVMPDSLSGEPAATGLLR